MKWLVTRHQSAQCTSGTFPIWIFSALRISSKLRCPQKIAMLVENHEEHILKSMLRNRRIDPAFNAFRVRQVANFSIDSRQERISQLYCGCIRAANDILFEHGISRQ